MAFRRSTEADYSLFSLTSDASNDLVCDAFKGKLRGLVSKLTDTQIVDLQKARDKFKFLQENLGPSEQTTLSSLRDAYKAIMRETDRTARAVEEGIKSEGELLRDMLKVDFAVGSSTAVSVTREADEASPLIGTKKRTWAEWARENPGKATLAATAAVGALVAVTVGAAAAAGALTHQASIPTPPSPYPYPSESPTPIPTPSASPHISPSPFVCSLNTEQSMVASVNKLVDMMRGGAPSNCDLAQTGAVVLKVLQSTVNGVISACGNFAFGPGASETTCTGDVAEILAGAQVKLTAAGGSADFQVTAPLAKGGTASGPVHLTTFFDVAAATASAVAKVATSFVLDKS